MKKEMKVRNLVALGEQILGDDKTIIRITKTGIMVYTTARYARDGGGI